MKKVFVANKNTYGLGFNGIHNTLDELKRAIVKHELNPFEYEDEEYTDEMYTEELFETCHKSYFLFEINLHETETIEFGEYDGTSWHTIEKKDKNILSTSTFIKGD